MHLSVIYATQTGTSRELAQRIALEGVRRKHTVTLGSVDKYDCARLPSEKLVVFVVSTAGDGEEPYSMRSFWRILLQKSLASDSLKRVSYAVFGVGDSSYTKFNFCAKRLFNRLGQLGAKPLIPRFDGDYQAPLGYHSALAEFEQALWDKIAMFWPTSGVSWLKSETPPSKTKVVVASGAAAGPAAVPSMHTQIECTVSSNTRITTPDHFQDVRLITLHSPLFQQLSFAPGDVAVVSPRNSERSVDRALELLRFNDIADLPLHISAQRSDFECDRDLSGLSLRRLFAEYFDLNAQPTAACLLVLSRFCASTEHKEKLLDLSSPENQTDFEAYVLRPRRTVLEVIEDFCALPPLEYIFDVFGKIDERYFSIASSRQEMAVGLLKVCYAVVQYRTDLITPRKGLCTSWLKTLGEADTLRIGVAKGTLCIPHGDLLLVGSGTGISPLRSVILSSTSDRRMVLFHGHRTEKKDALLHSDLEGILPIHSAVSREKDRIYVQDLVLRERELVRSMVMGGAHLCVAGNSKLPKELRQALLEIGLDETEIERRMHSETW